MLGQSEFNVLVDGRAASKITQGITTEITGEGASIAPMNDRMFELGASRSSTASRFRSTSARSASTSRGSTRRHQPRSTSARFVGAGGVRSYVMGDGQRDGDAGRARADEDSSSPRRWSRARLASQHLAAIRAQPLCLDRRARRARRRSRRQYGGIYITHQRSESAQIMESLDEVFAIAERAKIPAEVWHLKTAYKANWGRMPEVLRRIRRGARPRTRRHREHVPVRSRVERARRVPAAVGARGRPGADAAAIEGPGASRTNQARDGDPNAGDWENQWYGSGGGPA